MVSLLFGPLHLHQNRARGWFSQSHKQWMDNGMKKTNRNSFHFIRPKCEKCHMETFFGLKMITCCTKPPKLSNVQWEVCILFLHQWKSRIYYQYYWRHSFTLPRNYDWTTHESLINVEKAAIIRVKLTIICFKFINI